MPDDMRVTIAEAAGKSLTKLFKSSTARLTQTTSGCPLLVLAVGGEIYNLTITKPRTPRAA